MPRYHQRPVIMFVEVVVMLASTLLSWSQPAGIRQAPPEVSVIRSETVPHLRPQFKKETKGPALGMDEYDQRGFRSFRELPSLGYMVMPRIDPRLTAREEFNKYPMSFYSRYPLVCYQGTDFPPSEPNAPAGVATMTLQDPKNIYWQWDVPEKYWYHDRAKSYSNTPPGPSYPVLLMECTWSVDPLLILFHYLRGLRWRTSVPLQLLQDNAPEFNDNPLGLFKGRPTEMPDWIKGYVNHTYDGRQVLVALDPSPKRNKVGLFVYASPETPGDEPRLNRLLIFPGTALSSAASAESIAGAGHDPPSFNRSYSMNSFVLNLFRHRLSTIPTNEQRLRSDRWNAELESYLINREGNVIGLFVDDEDRPVFVSCLVSKDDTLAIGFRMCNPGNRKDGFWRYEYDLTNILPRPPWPPWPPNDTDGK